MPNRIQALPQNCFYYKYNSLRGHLLGVKPIIPVDGLFTVMRKCDCTGSQIFFRMGRNSANTCRQTQYVMYTVQYMLESVPYQAV
jgi:hypothetical protein